MAEKQKLILRAKLLAFAYFFILGLVLLKDLFIQMNRETVFQIFQTINSPLQLFGAGWLTGLILQSSSVGAILLNTLVGLNFFPLEQTLPPLAGLFLGNSLTALFVVLLVRNKKHWNFRQGFELAFANYLFIAVLLILILTLEALTSCFTRLGLFSTTYFSGSSILFLPSLIDIVVAPVKTAFVLGAWPFYLKAPLALLLIMYPMQKIGSLTLCYFGGREAAEEKIETLLGSKLKAGIYAMGMTLLIPSSSILVSLMVPLAVSGVLTLRLAMPLIIGCNVGTYIDVFFAALATGLPGAMGTAVILNAMAFCGLFFLFIPGGTEGLRWLVRKIALHVIPPKKPWVILLLLANLLICLLLIFIPA